MCPELIGRGELASKGIRGAELTGRRVELISNSSEQQAKWCFRSACLHALKLNYAYCVLNLTKKIAFIKKMATDEV